MTQPLTPAILSQEQLDFAAAPLQTLNEYARSRNDHYALDLLLLAAERLGLTTREGYWHRPEQEADPAFAEQ